MTGHSRIMVLSNWPGLSWFGFGREPIELPLWISCALALIEPRSPRDLGVMSSGILVRLEEANRANSRDGKSDADALIRLEILDLRKHQPIVARRSFRQSLESPGGVKWRREEIREPLARLADAREHSHMHAQSERW